MKVKGLIFALSVVVLVGGCAPNAQHVKLVPEVEVTERFTEQSPELSLRVIDRRAQKILGYRDPARGIILGVEGELADEVRKGLVSALERQGIAVKEWDGEADNRLSVGIMNFEYQRTGGFLRRQVVLETEWDVTASFEGTRVSSQARAKTQQSMLFVPGDSKNEQLVNTILNRAINQVVNNDDLLEQLRQQATD